MTSEKKKMFFFCYNIRWPNRSEVDLEHWVKSGEINGLYLVREKSKFYYLKCMLVNEQKGKIKELKKVSKDLGRSSKENLKFFVWIFFSGSYAQKGWNTHFLFCTSLYLLNKKTYFAIVFRFLWGFWRNANKLYFQICPFYGILIKFSKNKYKEVYRRKRFFLIKVAITPNVHIFFIFIFCQYLSIDTAFNNYLPQTLSKKSVFQKKKNIYLPNWAFKSRFCTNVQWPLYYFNMYIVHIFAHNKGI